MIKEFYPGAWHIPIIRSERIALHVCWAARDQHEEAIDYSIRLQLGDVRIGFHFQRRMKFVLCERKSQLPPILFRQ